MLRCCNSFANGATYALKSIGPRLELNEVRNSVQCSTKTCAQLRCFENGNDDFGVEAFWIGDAARVGYFVPLNGPLNGHPPSIY